MQLTTGIGPNGDGRSAFVSHEHQSGQHVLPNGTAHQESSRADSTSQPADSSVSPSADGEDGRAGQKERMPLDPDGIALPCRSIQSRTGVDESSDGNVEQPDAVGRRQDAGEA